MSKDNRSDGLLSICIPTNIDLTIPSFSLYYFTEVYEYTVYSKDLTLAKEILPKLKSIISVFTDRIKDGIADSFSGKNHWNFYEWTDGLSGRLHQDDSPGAEAALNCLLSIALQNIDKICGLTGDSERYASIATELNKNIYKAFFNKEKCLIANKPQSFEFSELVNSLAILCGAVSENEAKSICEVLASDNELTKVSLSMKCFKYDALIKIDKEKYRDFILNDIKQCWRHTSEMCSFFNVSRSGYYGYLSRMDIPAKDLPLAEKIQECQERCGKTYGYRRVHIWLEKKGIHHNPKTILRVMQKYNLLSDIRRKKYRNYGEYLHRYPNLLNRDFKAERPNQKWVTDISYIKTKQGTYIRL